jgi:hypothetical protein
MYKNYLLQTLLLNFQGPARGGPAVRGAAPPQRGAPQAQRGRGGGPGAPGGPPPQGGQPGQPGQPGDPLVSKHKTRYTTGLEK